MEGANGDAKMREERGRVAYLRKTPPRSEALRHSGGERRRWTSPTVTLYLEVDDRSESRPGTEQNTSVGETGPDSNTSDDAAPFYKSSDTKPKSGRQGKHDENKDDETTEKERKTHKIRRTKPIKTP